MLITGWTLVDITRTGRIVDDDKSRNQQRNWEALRQTIALRTTILDAPAASVHEKNTALMKFGPKFNGTHLVWSFSFQVDGIDKEKLNDDINMVPIVLGLSETADISIPLFSSMEHDRNIYFE